MSDRDQITADQAARVKAEDDALAKLPVELGHMIIRLGEQGDLFEFSIWDIALAVTDDPAQIAALEVIAQKTQAEAVDARLEPSYFTPGVPEFHGGRGSFEERRNAVKAELRQRSLAAAHS